MTKNVLFITRKWPPAVGGMETYCTELVAALKSHVNLSVEALPGRQDGTPPTALALIGFGLRSLIGLAGPRPKYDVIHAADMAIWPLALAASMRAPGAKIVLSAHGTDVAFANRRGILPLLYRLYLRLGARLLRNHTVLANSHATATLLRGHGFTKLQTVRLASTTHALATPVTPDRYVLFVGRLIKRKGCAWFIKTVLPNLPSDIRLKVAGTVVDDEERSALDNARVVYLETIFGEDLASLRRRAIAVIVPNIIEEGMRGFEGFGLTAVEGAADGGVVVAAATDGITDAVINERTGFLLPAGEPEAWVQKIEEIANWTQSEREQFISGSLNETAEYFTWARVARDTMAVYASKSEHP